MARGKYLSLEEARKSGDLDQFAKEHPAKAVKARFNRLFKAMAAGKPSAEPETSTAARDAGCDETPPRKDSSEDAS